MANAYKCDRCGKLFEREKTPNVHIEISTHGYGDEYMDLCAECQKYLETWIRERENEN